MDAAEKMPQLAMERSLLEDLPEIHLPEGFSIRSYQDGWDKEWEAIIGASFQITISFHEAIALCKQYNPANVLFVCHGDKPVGTATAWYRDDLPEGTGYLHMVGLLPEYGGRGLGLSISLAVLHNLKKSGYAKVFLHTDDFRLPAIKQYLRLGFKPVYNSEGAAERWQAVGQILHNP
ncbi:MAG: GNAT family N-acetyltransferase [Clostridiaceae bacterium]|nr:GNAT family N-acetyltransferase [Clostridiaceae bacterium]